MSYLSWDGIEVALPFNAGQHTAIATVWQDGIGVGSIQTLWMRIVFLG
ncbi:hypothetical protein [Roseimaritima ulvae]|nr:hypothetical protein [Roseimaritima ulvae]